MSALDQVPATLTGPSKKKTRRSDKRPTHAKSNSHDRLKTAVRRLPPNLPEEIFWQSVQKWVSADTVTWKCFYPGKLRKKLNKENIHSRAYIAFKSEELVAIFNREYDGHVFRDKAGNESQAVVEFAPYQKLPPSDKKKHDSRAGTIEKDEDYIAFMQNLEKSLSDSAAKPYDAETLLETLIASTVPQPQPTSTPLLEALKAEKTAQKDKEAIQRNHSHYKDTISKKDEKKRGAATTAATIVSASLPATAATIVKDGAPLGKRAAKKARAAAAAAPAENSAPTQAAPVSSKVGGTSTSGPPVQAKHAQPNTPKKNRGGSSNQPTSTQPPQPLEAPPPLPSGAPPAEAPSSVPAQQPRRSRPILTASARHFEAALSGAGVQKAKREQKGRDKEEKGKEREKEKELEGKGKVREAEKEQRVKPVSGKTPVSGSASAQRNNPPAPMILQREGVHQQPTKIIARPDDTAATAPIETSPARGGAGGGGARGRGRNRGKGGAGSRGSAT